MKLIVAIKLLPSEEQANTLKQTLRIANEAASAIGEIAWERKSFGQYKLHKLVYHDIKDRFGLSAQMVVRAIAKVADAYKLDQTRKRAFKPLGSIAYDDRILRYYDSGVSIWTVSGRERIRFVCDERANSMLRLRRGESDLVYREGKWYLLATAKLEEPPLGTPEGWVGVDLGIKNIAADSDGKIYCGRQLRGLRHRYARMRDRLQAKQSRAAKRLLKKRRKKEERMARHVNHTISKRIVCKAQDTNRGIALEDLKGICERITARRRQRRTLHSWSFAQLRSFVEYKAKLAGIPVLFVDPRNTSRTCPKCGHCEKRNRPDRDTFRCVSCGFSGAADNIAAVNIGRAAVDRPDLACGAVASHS